MKYYELDKEEQKLLDEVERGEWCPVKNQATEKKKLMDAARNTLNKTRAHIIYDNLSQHQLTIHQSNFTLVSISLIGRVDFLLAHHGAPVTGP